MEKLKEACKKWREAEQTEEADKKIAEKLALYPYTTHTGYQKLWN